MGIVVTNNIAVATGALTGTTGADGKLTLSSDGAGLIYIENRLGAARTWGVTLLCAT